MNYLQVPDSNLRIYDGSIVILARIPEIRWIVHHGWYNYHGRQHQGWYFSSIPAETILPVDPEDLKMITVVSDKQNKHCPPPPGPPHPPHPPYPPYPPEPPYPPYPPCPPDPDMRPAFFSQEFKKELQKAFISVANIEERDKLLEYYKIPDGKIVRVADVNGEVRFYAWSAFNDRWEDSDFVLQEDLDENYYTSDETDEFISTLDDKITEVDTHSVHTDTEVIAGDGLAGGGALESDITLSHGETGTGQEEQYVAEGSKVSAITEIDVDAFGHVSNAIASDYTEAIAEMVSDAIATDPTIAHIEDIPTWVIAE